MSLADTLERFATGEYTVTRRARAAYQRGRAVSTTPTTLTISASVQPLSGRELMRLPEGERTTERLAVYTATALLAGSPAYEPDLVSIYGESWEVETVEDWRAFGDFIKAVVRKVAP